MRDVGGLRKEAVPLAPGSPMRGCPTRRSSSCSALPPHCLCHWQALNSSIISSKPPEINVVYVLGTERTPVSLVRAALALFPNQLPSFQRPPYRHEAANGCTESPGSLRKRRSTCPGWGGRARRRASLWVWDCDVVTMPADK